MRDIIPLLNVQILINIRIFQTIMIIMRFEVLKVVTIIFWDVTPCTSVDIYCHFRVTCYLHFHDSLLFYPEM